MGHPPLNLQQASSQPREPSRPWIGIHYLCAGKYIRVYRSADGSGYQARCPQCGRCTAFRVGEGGSSSRQFEVSCR
ncbi:MAG: hypothetical protein HND58_13790 [Planctomycetota bacterium]|nr:MAG: hypothetical protein HND58_13790 [Planctomycetota bacterium]